MWIRIRIRNTDLDQQSSWMRIPFWSGSTALLSASLLVKCYYYAQASQGKRTKRKRGRDGGKLKRLSSSILTNNTSLTSCTQAARQIIYSLFYRTGSQCCWAVPFWPVRYRLQLVKMAAPASQDGGSSSSCVFHNFLLYKKFWIISFPSLLGLFLFPESYECFPLFSVLTALHLKRQIHFLLDCSKFGLFNSLNIGQSWRWSCSRSRPFFYGSGFR